MKIPLGALAPPVAALLIPGKAWFPRIFAASGSRYEVGFLPHAILLARVIASRGPRRGIRLVFAWSLSVLVSMQGGAACETGTVKFQAARPLRAQRVMQGGRAHSGRAPWA